MREVTTMQQTRVFNDIKFLNIFDLDGTVINSFHRVRPYLDEETGNLDLTGYIQNACTHELVQADTLLPLAAVMKENINKGDTHNVIVTARTMYKSDYYYLRKQGLTTNKPQAASVMSRTTLARYFALEDIKDVYYSRDAEYKRKYFEILQAMYPNAVITVYDDHQGVLSVAREMGFQVVDATLVNDVLNVGYRMAGEQFIDQVMEELHDPEALAEHIETAWCSYTQEERDYLSSKFNKLVAISA